MYSLKGENSTELYLKALKDLVKDGDECCPRGKLIKELRPASVEFTNPYNRITFLGSRRVNPFFMIAESLWIVSGKADVEWLTKFNANIGQFSDDGVWFNAPYGERIRSWNKNNAHNVIINPIDQLVDVYKKLMVDKDTRQAVIVISNPMFDNSKYTIGEHGKDIACNLVITFKVRHNRLNMTVFNRSNDANWGLWGANLCQFTTIQEVLMNWLKHSGNEEFAELEVGDYCQVTDSLHIYLDDYGAKCTTDVLEYYSTHSEDEVLADFNCVNEPRMSLNAEQFDQFLTTYWSAFDPYTMDDEYLSNDEDRDTLMELIDDFYGGGAIDDYWYFGIKSMIAYRLVKLDKVVAALKIMKGLVDCQWKISMMYFLKSFIYKVGKDVSRTEEYNTILEDWDEIVSQLVSSLKDQSSSEQLMKYLEL